MTAWAMCSVVLAAAAVLSFPPPQAVHRLAAVTADPASTAHRIAGVHRTTAEPARASYRERSRRAIAPAVGLGAVAVLLCPWWVAVLVAMVAGGLGWSLPQRRGRQAQADDLRRLAVHADLFAACLDAGLSVGAALLAVPAADLRARDGPSTAPDQDDPLVRLAAVAALLLLGTDPDRAWQPAADHPALASLAAAARRSSVGGAVLAGAVREHATAVRAQLDAAAQRAAGRAGVAMTAPLGLCFLPAFLCLGLAPVVVGLVGTLHLL